MINLDRFSSGVIVRIAAGICTRRGEPRQRVRRVRAQAAVGMSRRPDTLWTFWITIRQFGWLTDSKVGNSASRGLRLRVDRQRFSEVSGRPVSVARLQFQRR